MLGRALRGLGEWAMESTAGFGQVALRNLGSFTNAVWEGINPPFRFYWRESVAFAASAGVDALGITALTATVAGVTSSWLLAEQVRNYGIGLEFMGLVVAQGLVDQLMPILVSLVIAGRTGSAITAAIGTMKITEQTEALKSLDTDPIQFLFIPRVVGLVGTLPMLVIFGSVVGTVTGWYAAHQVVFVSWATWSTSIEQLFRAKSLFEAMQKSMYFGGIIALVSFYQGWAVVSGTEELARRIQNGVVGSMVLILVANFILTVFVY